MNEDALALHPSVADAAGIGVSDAEMGEALLAVIEPAEGVAPTPALAEQLTAFLRGKGRYVVPRAIELIDRMPRLPTGKLYQRALREPYARAV